MKELKLTVTIDKSVEDVFTFTLNPENTPKWVDGIKYEETNELPVKLGTIFRNHGKDSNVWSEFDVTEFVPNRRFVLSKRGSGYHVRYIFTPLSPDTTELEYYEWMGSTELAEPSMLQKLKNSMESHS
jgi:uncharacterized protein YndB with AHSA1/START domain